jgi:hypothetical protein
MCLICLFEDMHNTSSIHSQRESPSLFLGGSESGLSRLGSGEGLGTSFDEAMARRHLGMACHSGGRLPSALAVALRNMSLVIYH